MPQVYPIHFRRGLASNWRTKNPVLDSGEPGYEEDTSRLKIGDGETRWNDLDYFQAGSLDDPSYVTLIANHIGDPTPHPAYDDGPSFVLLYENKKV